MSMAVSGMLITLLVVGSAFSLTNLSGSNSAGCMVSIGSRSGDRLVFSCGNSESIGMS